ncbi:MAG: ATP-dependent Clp protease proteolytic subunit [Planctomycetota bacterium]|nr:MAG: ATP-dependent Clp protease proteolytic subunit [Planctomycetota bacterium]
MPLFLPKSVANMPEAKIDKTISRQQLVSLDDLLMEHRVIYLIGVIDSESAAQVIKKLLYLRYDDPKADIHMYIHSPGGELSAGMSIYDTMQAIEGDVATVCTGYAASAAALVLCAGTKGKRYCLPHAEVMIHQVLGGITGTTVEAEIYMNLLRRWKRAVNEIIARHTGQPLEKVEADSDRDKWLPAEEAKAYGLIDEVISELPM